MPPNEGPVAVDHDADRAAVASPAGTVAGAAAGMAVPSPIPIGGAKAASPSPPPGSVPASVSTAAAPQTGDSTTKSGHGVGTALSVSPAAAFAKLGLGGPGYQGVPQPHTQQDDVFAVPPKPRRLPSANVGRRRLSNHNGGGSKRPVFLHGQTDEFPVSASASVSRVHSSSLPASSLLLLSTSAEAAVLESMRFEQGGRTASQLAALGLAHTGTTPPGVTAAPSTTSAVQVHPLPQLAANPAAAGPKGGRRPRSSSSASLAVFKPERADKDKREKGQVFKCEKCSKVYRHPQCLVKHRWEHTTYWADASKLMLSKHQQVQMLEAAAILSAPYGSLPESRSLWPAAVSPSAAGLYGSNQINIDLLKAGASPEIGTARPHPAGALPRIPGADVDGGDEADADDVDDDGSGSVVSDDDDDPMFNMSINGDGESTSGASTAETTSGKGSGNGSGDEKDSGYASGPTQQTVDATTSGSEAKDIVMDHDHVVVSGGPSSAGTRFSISAPPPMGYFDTRERMSRQGSVAPSGSPPSVIAPLPAVPLAHVNASSPHFGAYRSTYPSPSPSLTPVSIPLASAFGSSFRRPSERSTSTSVSSSSFFVSYAASDVRGTIPKAGHDEPMEEDQQEQRERWRRDNSDEVADMEL